VTFLSDSKISVALVGPECNDDLPRLFTISNRRHFAVFFTRLESVAFTLGPGQNPKPNTSCSGVRRSARVPRRPIPEKTTGPRFDLQVGEGPRGPQGRRVFSRPHDRSGGRLDDQAFHPLIGRKPRKVTNEPNPSQMARNSEPVQKSELGNRIIFRDFPHEPGSINGLSS
jgi:hypothetical protein